MREGELIYYCTQNGKDGFNPPVQVRLKFGKFSVMRASGNSFIEKLGFKISGEQTGIAQPYLRWKNIIKENDLFYLEGATPSKDEEFYGQNANYRVKDVGYGANIMIYTFEKI